MNESREHYTIFRALYEAVRHLERLPQNQRPESDIDDMRELLNSRYRQLYEIQLIAEGMAPPPPPVAKLVVPAKPSEDEPAQ